MYRNTWWGGTLRFIGIVLMALTAGFTLLGGIGTICAALFPTKWVSMAPLASFQWLYILFVLSGVALGILGIWATIKLIRGISKAYRMSVQILVAGVIIGGFHIYMSRLLRGKSMPVDAVVYMTLLTLVIFLLFRIPFIWQGVDFDNGDGKINRMAAGVASILLSIITLTIQYTMRSTHTWNGVNYANAFNMLMASSTIGLLALGIRILVGKIKVRLLCRKQSADYRLRKAKGLIS
jgi:hypothetical protein